MALRSERLESRAFSRASAGVAQSRRSGRLPRWRRWSRPGSRRPRGPGRRRRRCRWPSRGKWAASNRDSMRENSRPGAKCRLSGRRERSMKVRARSAGRGPAAGPPPSWWLLLASTSWCSPSCTTTTPMRSKIQSSVACHGSFRLPVSNLRLSRNYTQGREAARPNGYFSGLRAPEADGVQLEARLSPGARCRMRRVQGRNPPCAR